MRVFDFNLFANDPMLDTSIKQQMWKYLYVVDGARVRKIAEDEGVITAKDSGFFEIANQYVSLRWTKRISLAKYLKWKKERDARRKEGRL